MDNVTQATLNFEKIAAAYAHATIADAPQITRQILALRDVARRSNLKTTDTQSAILRSIPATVLCEVALQLQKAEAK